MASKKAITPKSYQTIPVQDLTGGLDLRTALTLMRPNTARRLTNWSLEQPGALMVRPGFDTFTESSLAFNSSLGYAPSQGELSSNTLQGAGRIYLSPVNSTGGFVSTAVTIIINKGAVLSVGDSGGQPTLTLYGQPGGYYPPVWGGSWYSGIFLSTVSMVDIVHERELAAVFDGVSSAHPKTFDGTHWSFLGLAPPVTPMTVSSLTTGSMSSAEFELAYTWKHRSNGFETNAGGSTVASTITLTGSSGSIKCVIPNYDGSFATSIGVQRDDVDAVVVYARNKTAGETVRRRATSGAITGGSATSTLVITSSAWTSNDPEPTDHNRPSVLSFAAVWKNRWWGAGATQKNRLFFSQIYLPEAWPASYFLDLPFERGDEIRALIPMGDVFVVMGYTQAFIIVGQTPVEFEVRPAMGIQEGAFGFRAVCKIEEGILHAGASGVYLFDGQTDRFMSEALEPAWRDFIQNTSGAVLRRTAMVYDRQRKEVRLALSRKYPSGTRGEFVLDMLRTRESRDGAPAWVDTDRTWAHYLTFDGPEEIAGNQHRIFGCPSSRAVLVEENIGATADGADITATYEGPGIVLGNVVARWIDCIGEYEPHEGAFSIQPTIDGEDLSSITIDISKGLARYGFASYGKWAYPGTGRRQFYTAFELRAEGRTIQMAAEYIGQERFLWYGYAPGLVPELMIRGFSE